MSIAVAIHERLAADATLTALLGTFGGSPCIFTPQVPPGAPRPYVIVDPSFADARTFQVMTGQDTRSIDGDVSVYVDFTGSASGVDAIAERVRALLHANGRDAGLSTPLTVSGYNGIHTSVVSGPVAAETDDSIEGRTVTVRAMIERAT